LRVRASGSSALRQRRIVDDFDSERTAVELGARIARSGPVGDYHVNLIPVNAGPGGFKRPPIQTMEKFAEVLTAHGIAATVRISKGQDIAAGCGQLKVDEPIPVRPG